MKVDLELLQSIGLLAFGSIAIIVDILFKGLVIASCVKYLF
jgi:hypothetical protein